MTDIFIPKGSMCAACAHRNLNCSFRDFAGMPRLEQIKTDTETLVVVRCTDFQAYRATVVRKVQS